MKDVKEIFLPKNENDKKDMKKEFIRECHKNDTVPKSTLVIHNNFKKELFGLINTVITPGQAIALGKTFKLLDHVVKELYFANNNLSDLQFANMLREIISEQTIADNIDKIIYGKNNELGPETMETLLELVDKKRGGLTQLAFVGCKSRLSTMAPIL